MGNSYSRSSHITSDLETDTIAIPPNRLLSLPPELRLAIYAQTLLTDRPLHWIGLDPISDNRISLLFAGFLPKLIGARTQRPTATTRRPVSSYASTTTALLFTCKTIYRDAIEFFYQNNTFVIQAMKIGFRPVLRQQPFLSLVQRLCIQFHDSIDLYNMNAKDFLDLADTSISSCLQNIIDNCPNLESLTICGIPHPGLMDRHIWDDDYDSSH